VKLRLDEMVPVRVARELRSAGFDVDAVVEHPHLRGLPDREQLARAAADGCAFVTYDAGDLLPLALDRTAASQGHAGLVLLRSPRFPQAEWRALVRGLVDLLEGPEAAADFIHWLE
jgi:hypothetical protein